MDIKLYQFSKKINSTKRPSGGTTYSCTLKDPTSVLRPVVLISSSGSSILNKNYAYISTFGRYYWITDMVSDHNMWEIHMSVDVLASYRSEILDSYQYVERAANASSDNGIVDGKYACTVNTQMENISITGSGSSSGSSGSHRAFMNAYRCMMAATTQGASDGVHPQTLSGTAYYYMTPAKAENFIKYLLDDPTYLSLNVDEISDSLAKGIINPVQYIGESYILPYELIDMDTPTSNVSQCKMYVGWWPIDPSNTYECMNWSAAFKKLKIWESNQIVLSNHPQSSTIGKYVNTAPFSEIQLYAGPFGYIQIDPLLLTKYTAMKLVVYGDFKGQSELDILFYDGTAQSYVTWKKFFADVKIPITLTQLSSDGVKALSGAGAGISKMASGFVKDDPAGMIGGAMSGILSLAGSQIPTIQGQTILPSTTYMKDDWFVHCEYHMVTDQAPNLKGRPFCEDVQLSDLAGTGGYILVSEPVLDLDSTSQELSDVMSYMRSGMFLE